MSINTAHANNGVLIHSGEYILLFSDNVTMEFPGRDEGLFRGTKQGRIYLTTHRMIFNNKLPTDPIQSFSFPFISLNDVEIEQPVFGANYIKGVVAAQENGNFNGRAKFKLLFKGGGAIDFGQAMLRAAGLAMRNAQNQAPPPYSPPNGPWYQAPPPAYTPNPQGYYGWVPQSQNFPYGPPPDGVFMTDNPPPYPGIAPGGANQQPYPGSSAPAYNNGHTGGFAQPPGNYAAQPTGYPAQPSGYSGQPGGYPAPQGAGYPPQAGGFPQQMGAGDFAANPGFAGYPGQQPGYPNTGYGGYPNPSFSQPQPNSKEAEAAQSAYYDPNQPQTAYVPPPAYYEPPPSYNSLANKKGQ